jgi:hypothetical protein
MEMASNRDDALRGLDAPAVRVEGGGDARAIG